MREKKEEHLVRNGGTRELKYGKSGMRNLDRRKKGKRSLITV